MLIGEVEAIAAARAYADSQGLPAWVNTSVRAVPVVVQGKDYWRVMAHDALRPDQTWMDVETDSGRSFLVDQSGTCVGIGLMNGYMLFKK